MQSVYPTREEILAYRPNAPPQLIELVRTWKADTWIPNGRTKSNVSKYLAISSLIQRIALDIYNNPVTVEYIPNRAEGPSYFPERRHIVLTDPISILSGLHEIGHHIYGQSELDACEGADVLVVMTPWQQFGKLDPAEIAQRLRG